MAKKRPLQDVLRATGIDPHAWMEARIARDEFADWLLARDIEDLLSAQEYDRSIMLEDGETVLDLFAMICLAQSRWPLREDATVA